MLGLVGLRQRFVGRCHNGFAACPFWANAAARPHRHPTRHRLPLRRAAGARGAARLPRADGAEPGRGWRDRRRGPWRGSAPRYSGGFGFRRTCRVRLARRNIAETRRNSRNAALNSRSVFWGYLRLWTRARKRACGLPTGSWLRHNRPRAARLVSRRPRWRGWKRISGRPGEAGEGIWVGGWWWPGLVAIATAHITLRD